MCGDSQISWATGLTGSWAVARQLGCEQGRRGAQQGPKAAVRARIISEGDTESAAAAGC